MRRWLVVGAVGVGLVSGCNSLDRGRGRAPVKPASRTKEKDADDWLAGPAGDRGDDRGRGREVGREAADVLAGFVVTPDGRKARDVAVEVDLNTAGPAAGAPVEVRTDGQGYFRIQGLKPRQAYTLTARARADGLDLAGRVYAQTGTDRSQRIQLQLVEGLTFPTVPAADRVPPPVLPVGPGREMGALDLAIPPVSRPAGPPAAPVETLPPPLGVQTVPVQTVNPPPPLIGPPPRRDLQTATPDTTRQPVMSIPGSRQSKSVAVRPNAEFALADPAGVAREFPTGRADSLVLLDFMTTTCVPCKKALPVLKGLQAKHGGRTFEVVGVVCDDAPAAERRTLAAQYQRKHDLKYLLYTEPAATPGALLKRFDIDRYPTLVLLDGAGAVLWKGHPADAAELERAIAKGMGQ